MEELHFTHTPELTKTTAQAYERQADNLMKSLFFQRTQMFSMFEEKVSGGNFFSLDHEFG